MYYSGQSEIDLITKLRRKARNTMSWYQQTNSFGKRPNFEPNGLFVFYIFWPNAKKPSHLLTQSQETDHVNCDVVRVFSATIFDSEFMPLAFLGLYRTCAKLSDPET